MSATPRWMAPSLLCAAASGCFIGLSSLQRRDWCAQLILSTTVVYGLLFGLLKMFGTVPPGVPAPDWRERKLSTLNALILIVGSCLCFSEWALYEGSEGWISRGVSFWPVLFASLFVGYLQWDVLWMLWHSYRAIDELAHHLIFIAITHYVLWGRYFARPFAWLAFTELSTPFLNERWFLQSSGQRAGKAYNTYSLLFALTFLFTRVGGYGLGLVDLWLSRELWRPAHWGLHVVIGLLHVGYGLNLLWASKVVRAAQRAVKGQHSQ